MPLHPPNQSEMPPVPMPSLPAQPSPVPPVPMPSGNAPVGDTPAGDGDDAGRRRIMIVLAAAVAIVALLAVGTFLFTRHQTMAMADTCRQEQDRLTGLAATLGRTMDTARDAAGTDASNLDDAATLTTLKTAIDGTATPDAAKLDCGTDQPFRDLKANAERLKELADTAEKDNGRLAKAVDAVTASRDGKSLADSRKSLNGSIAKAESILAKARNNVTDRSTITALQTSIDNAKKVADSDSPSLNDITRANRELTAAINKVNGSMTAKQNADRALQQRQQQAQQEQRAELQQQQSQSQSQSQGGTQQAGGIPNGGYSYVAPVGGARNSVSVVGSKATVTEGMSTVSPDRWPTTVYTISGSGPTYTFTASNGKTRTYTYDANAHTLTDSYGFVYEKVR